MKTMTKWSFLLLLLCMLPLQLWAKNIHYDAGYGSWSFTRDSNAVKLKIERLRLYNYQGDNSHFSSDGTITIYVGDDEHVLRFSDLSFCTHYDQNFYYDGEGDEDCFKGDRIFGLNLYRQTRGNIKVTAFINNRVNSTSISPDDAVGYTSGTSDKWCLAELTIKVFTQSSLAINLQATWRDHSDGINQDHEPVDWWFNYYQSDITDLGAVESLDEAEPEYYDLSGRRLTAPQRGTNIMKRGGKTSKVIIK